MKQIIEGIESLTPRLRELELEMAKGDLSGTNADDLLGANPQLGFSKLIEFKAALDRMRSVTWVYMEAAAAAGRLPAQRVPHLLREFLRQEATKADAGHGKKSK